MTTNVHKRLYRRIGKEKAFTVFYDSAFGELKDILPAREFSCMPALLRLDVLKDSIEGLTEIYNSILKEARDAKSSRKQNCGKRRERKGKDGPSQRETRSQYPCSDHKKKWAAWWQNGCSGQRSNAPKAYVGQKRR